MWDALREICRRERASTHQICTSVSLQKPEKASLTSSIRVFIMRYYRNAATEEGHNEAGHNAVLMFGMGVDFSANVNNKVALALTKTSFA